MDLKEEVPTYVIVDEQGKLVPVETITIDGVEYNRMILRAPARRTLKKLPSEK